MANPVLVEVLRGSMVESRHCGAYAVSDSDGALVQFGGDVDRPVFPRSAVKAFQALPLLESGVADALGLTDAEIALAVSSHGGEAAHTATAAGMLAKVGRDGGALECGAHWPLARGAADDLVRTGARPTALHNNCSGKHAGFVCLACGTGRDPAGYLAASHPVMLEVMGAMSDMSGASMDGAMVGTDGCSIPTQAATLRATAAGFARFGSGIGLGKARAAAAARIRAAVAAEPFMVAGTDRFCTDVMRIFGARVFVKTGAEGVFCASFPELGLGVALKCEDGSTRAAEVMMAALIERLLPLSDNERTGLDRFVRPILRNWNGLTVGSLRPAGALADSFAL